MKKKVILSFLALSLMGGLLSLNAQARSHAPHGNPPPPPQMHRGHKMPPPPPPSRRSHIHANYYYYSPNAVFRYNSGYYPMPMGYYDPWGYPPNYYSNFYTSGGFSFGVSI